MRLYVSKAVLHIFFLTFGGLLCLLPLQTPLHLTPKPPVSVFKPVHNVDGAQKKQLQHILRHTKHVMLNTGSTAIIAFTGRKTASDQLYVSCQNDFLRENSECFKRVGKKPGSDHYNQYTYSPISPL